MEGSFIHTDPLPLKWLALVHFAVLTHKYDQFFVSCAQLVFLEVLYHDKIVAFLDLTLSLHCFQLFELAEIFASLFCGDVRDL